MQVINVTKAITLLLADGNKLEIPSGVQKVEDDVAEHWYVKAHTGEMPEAITKATADKSSKKPAAAGDPADDTQATAEQQ